MRGSLILKANGPLALTINIPDEMGDMDYEWKWLWTVTTRWSSPRWAGVPHRTSPSRRALIGTRFSFSSTISTTSTSSSCTCSSRGRLVTFAFRAVHLLLAVLALRWGSTGVEMNVEIQGVSKKLRFTGVSICRMIPSLSHAVRNQKSIFWWFLINT